MLAASTEDPVETFESIVDRVIEIVAEAQAKYAIQQAFPGTTVVPPNQTTGIPVADTAPAAGPAPVPGASSGKQDDEAVWREYFANPGAFYTNLGEPGYTNNKPAVKRKSDKKALWLISQYGNAPEWVFNQFRTMGYLV